MQSHWVSLSLRKSGDLRYLSHLDLLRVLERALRRSQLPLGWRDGFNPRPRLSAGDALPLGVASEAERFAFALERPVEPNEVIEWLRPQLPPGLEIQSVASGKLPPAPEATAWRLTFAGPLPSRDELLSRLQAAGPLQDARGRLREVWADPDSLQVEDESLTVGSLPGRTDPLRPELLARALGLEPPLHAIKLTPREGPAEKLEKDINVTYTSDQRVGPRGT